MPSSRIMPSSRKAVPTLAEPVEVVVAPDAIERALQVYEQLQPHDNSVILQADVQKGSYFAAWDLATGKPLWKTARTDEISTWGTPVIVRSADGHEELVTNGTKVRGYDPVSGKQLWTLAPNG